MEVDVPAPPTSETVSAPPAEELPPTVPSSPAREEPVAPPDTLPLANAELVEREALAARVAELEAQLAARPAKRQKTAAEPPPPPTEEEIARREAMDSFMHALSMFSLVGRTDKKRTLGRLSTLLGHPSLVSMARDFPHLEAFMKLEVDRVSAALDRVELYWRSLTEILDPLGKDNNFTQAKDLPIPDDNAKRAWLHALDAAMKALFDDVSGVARSLGFGTKLRGAWNAAWAEDMEPLKLPARTKKQADPPESSSSDGEEEAEVSASGRPVRKVVRKAARKAAKKNRKAAARDASPARAHPPTGGKSPSTMAAWRESVAKGSSSPDVHSGGPESDDDKDCHIGRDGDEGACCNLGE